ncbi:Unknown protein [Striga hermonthica]|uniref:Uncharacterized protein n=1 Tax=Striga hermonthica TaxID=68872 RepID=A0A9N7N8S2_STRHE|nr:Unknown protein [Striga hermonthica]
MVSHLWCSDYLSQGSKSAFRFYEFLSMQCLVAEEARSETTRARFSNVLKRNGEFMEKLSRYIFISPLAFGLNEFEAAQAFQTQEIGLDGEQWNDGLVATIRERVHMEAERKSVQSQGDAAASPDISFLEKITYRVGNKVGPITMQPLILWWR